MILVLLIKFSLIIVGNTISSIRRTLKQEGEKANLQRQLKESHMVCEALKRVVENLPTTKVKQNLVEAQVS